MLPSFINFIKKIQNSDASTKKFWLIIMSGAAMIIIVSAWLVVLKIPSATADDAKNPAQPSHFAIFIKGLGIIGSEVYNKLLPILIPGRSLELNEK